ncbi:polysaccharide lyase [Sungkyunkwania multivorans]|uniref:Polysaccharide lyase n=1 Tax=Sungkyunkwania multivorans TaxID=1173618 RepID=A0ABW3CW45_9FLAO
MKKIILIFSLVTFVTTNAQTLSGMVKDRSGNPIKNALVCHANTPSTWVKTEANGTFSIQGSVGTKLRIAALKFDTIDAYRANSTNGNTITMSDDPYLATDVYHISFDHLRPGASYSKAELKKDFPVAYGKGFYERNRASTDRAYIDYDESVDPNGVSLRIKFPKGKLKTSNSGVDTRIPLAGTFNSNNFRSEDLYLSYWIKFSDNFEFDKCGGKLPSLGGTTYNTRDDSWKGRIMWRKGGSIQFYMELPDNRFRPTNDERFWGDLVKSGSGICNFEYEPYLSSDGWHNIELHYKFETPGRNDGLFEGWVDGVNYDFMNATVFNNYRPAGTTRENITINRILISAFLGGSSEDYEPSEDIYAWVDEFRVSTRRINEYDTYREKFAKGPIGNDLSNASTIYPNPNSEGVFYLKTSTNWEVYTLLGQKILAGKGKKINIKNHSKGVYFVKIGDSTKKVIIQ